MTLTSASTVGSIAANVAGAARVFESLGIDYCCGGKRPLGDACAKRSLEVAGVIEKLEAASAGARTERDWTRASLTELADHIEATHHAFLRVELPRLGGLVDKVVRAHGERHPEMERVKQVYAILCEEMFSHMEKEERVLFPVIRSLERRERGMALDGPVGQMVHEHDVAAGLLREMRALTGNFTPPADACTTFRVLLRDLEALEKDLHQHVHKENNILFPGALALSGSTGESCGCGCRCST